MALPLIPFVAGAVIGGLVIHYYKDDKARQEFKKNAGDVSKRVRETAENVSHKVADGFGELRDKVARKGEPVSEPEEKKAEKAPVAKKKAAKKKATSKKKTAKKATTKKSESTTASGETDDKVS